VTLNTVKRYDRASEPERLQRVPKYRPALVGSLPGITFSSSSEIHPCKGQAVLQAD
jgi:hypothetical protein